MKLLTFLAGTTALLTIASANPVAEPAAELENPDADLELQTASCTKLSKSKCHIDGKKAGIYCGYCKQVGGSDWQKPGHRFHTYQLSSGKCCRYGYRKACEKHYLDKKYCPV